MNNITVLDSFISSYYQDVIEKQLLDDCFPYFLNTHTVDGNLLKEQEKNPLIKESLQFTHTFIRDGVVTSSFWPIISPLAFKFIEHLGENYTVFRCKANFNIRDLRSTSDNYFTPHVDYSDENIVTALYYAGNFDGDTFFFDKDLNITQRVAPQKGRFVYFQSNQLHAGQSSIETESRYLINFNFKRVN